MTLLVDDQFNTPEIRSMTHGIFGEISDATGWNKEISISLKEFHGVNQKKKPCLQDRTETVSKCIGRCFEREFVAKSRCRSVRLTMQSGGLIDSFFLHEQHALHDKSDQHTILQRD